MDFNFDKKFTPARRRGSAPCGLRGGGKGGRL